MFWWPLRAEFQIVRRALRFLEPHERRKLWILVPPVLTVAVLEVAGVASIAPFVALLSDPTLATRSAPLRYLCTALDLSSPEELFFGVGVGIFVLILLSNATSAATMWALQRYSGLRNASLSTRVLRSFLNRPYPFFMERNSTELVRKALLEVQNVVVGVIGQMTTLLARGAAVMLICAALFTIDPPLALGAIPIFGGAYGLLYLASRRFSTRSGQERTAAETRRYKTAGEALAGVKEIKLYRLEEAVVSAFQSYSVKVALLNANHTILSQIPRYALESIAFGGVLAIVLYELRYGNQLTNVLPVVGLYAFAAVRLLPALQAAFVSLTTLRFNAASVSALQQELDGAELDKPSCSDDPPLSFDRYVELWNVDFSYGRSARPILQNANLQVHRGEWLAIVGPTGSGKSTLIDILLGLLEPTRGSVRVDGIDLTGPLLRAWQAKVAYVPQQIFLIDDTIEANICFGISPRNVDHARVEEAAKIAQVHEFVTQELPLGYRTLVGDRGIRLSGGQRQRIGIARAIYRRPELLVLDEATSALDSVTEDAFFDALRESFSRCTVVSVTHRASTTRLFDRVCRVDAGQLTYSTEKLHGKSEDIAAQV